MYFFSLLSLSICLSACSFYRSLLILYFVFYLYFELLLLLPIWRIKPDDDDDDDKCLLITIWLLLMQKMTKMKMRDDASSLLLVSCVLAAVGYAGRPCKSVSLYVSRI